MTRPRSTFTTFGRDLATMMRVGGAPAVRKAVLYRTLHRVYRRDKLLLIENDLSHGTQGESPPGVEIRGLHESDCASLDPVATERTIRRFRQRLERGRWALVAWRGDCPVGYTWTSARLDVDLESYRLRLPSDAVYSWDLYVDRSERGRGVGSALVAARLGDAAQRGYRRSWRLISPGNPAALRTMEKTATGARVLREMTFLNGRMVAEAEPSRKSPSPR